MPSSSTLWILKTVVYLMGGFTTLSSTEQIPKRPIWKIIVLLALTSCAFSTGYLYWEFCYSLRIRERHFLTEQKDPDDVGDTFLFVLADQRLDLIDSYVIEEKRDEARWLSILLDESLTGCKFSWDPVGMRFSSPIDETHYLSGGFTNLDCKGRGIILKGFITLIKIDDKWFVQEWEEIEIN
ncbi:MAG: hypothetical protein AAF490_01140 [Chloroflexota bacterium]